MLKGSADWQGNQPGELAGHISSRLPALAALPWHFLVAGGVFITSLALYLSTLAPSVVTLFDDSLEFQLVTYRLGIAHPTGYPLYTLLGKLFTLLPVGNVAYRVNLMSAVFGAATVAILYLVILVSAAPPRARPWQAHLGGVAGAALLAASPVFWQQATVAEVYTLNAFFIGLLLLVAILPARTVRDRQRQLLWLAFLTGLALTHHRTVLLLLPALAVYLVAVDKASVVKALDTRTVLGALLLAGLPLLLYLYLPLRAQAGSLDGAYQDTWAGFWRQVSGGGYGLFILDNPFGQERPAGTYWQLLENQFYTTVPGFIGIFYLLWLGQRKILLLTGLAFVTYVTFNVFYKVSDIEVFFIPVFLVWAGWSGIGVVFLLGAALSLKRWRWVWAGLLVIVFVFITFTLVQTGRADLSRRYSWQVHDYGLDVLQQPLSNSPVIVGILGEMTLLRYFQQTENRRPDLQTVAADQEGERLAAVEQLLGQGKTVYLTRQLPGAPARWSLNAVGPLIRVDPEPVREPPQLAYPVGQYITPVIKLLGYNLSRPAQTGPGLDPLRLTLSWQADARLSTDLKVSARLLNSAGEPVAAVDAVPVHFAYPTTAWRPGEIVSDVYDLALPAGLQPGEYRPLLIWYDPAQNAAEVGRIELEPVRFN